MAVSGHHAPGEGRRLIDAGRRLLAAHPDVGAVVVECTNMPPYSHALRDALGLPVHDGLSFLTQLYRGAVGDQ